MKLPPRRILVATDGTARSQRAVSAAACLAARCHARLHVLFVIAEGVPTLFSGNRLYVGGVVSPRIRAEARRQADAVLARAAAAARRAGAHPGLLSRRADAPWHGILSAARGMRADLIVMASHGRHGAAARLLGSETMKVLAHSRIPVLVCR
jgi:nucleotide-binding universal stress UspA family protein